MKRTIFNTTFGRAYNLTLLAKNAGTLLEQTIPTDFTQEEYINIAKTANLLISNPIRTVYNSIRDKQYFDRMFYMSILTQKQVSLPELLTIRDVTVNGSEVSSVHTNEFKKMWIEASQCFSLSGARLEGPVLKSPTELANLVVRGMLCYAYGQSQKEWLSGKSQAFVIEVYARALANELNRIYKFNTDEYLVVAYGFAYYCAALLTDIQDENGAPQILNRIGLLTKRGKSDLNQLAKVMQELSGNYTTSDNFSMNTVVEFIKLKTSGRVSDLNTQTIYRRAFTSSRNNIATYIAMDYPPYLVYLLLKIGSGDKHPILTNVLEHMGNKSFIASEIDSLAKDTTLLA